MFSNALWMVINNDTQIVINWPGKKCTIFNITLLLCIDSEKQVQVDSK